MPTVQSIDIIDSEENYNKIAQKGQLYINQTFDLVKNLPLIVVPASSGGVNLPTMPSAIMRIRNLSGNDSMFVGGVGSDAPYVNDNGVFHGYELLGDQERDFPVNNGSILSVVARHSGQRINCMAFLNGNDVDLSFMTDPDPADFLPPTFLNSSPVSGASGVELDLRSPYVFFSGFISVTFNEALSNESGNFISANFNVNISGDTNQLSGILSLDSGNPNVMKFQPISGLQGSKMYQINLGAGIMDAAGNIWGQYLTIPFTTWTTPGSPQLVRTWPSSGASGIDLALRTASGASGGTVWATFDRDLASGSINAISGNFSVHNGSFGWSGALNIYSGDPHTIVFGPTSDLSGSLIIETLISSGLQEARYGLPLGQTIGIPWTTTTNPPGPSLLSTFPASGASGIDLLLSSSSGSSGGVVYAHFDRDLVSGNTNANSGNISLRQFGTGSGWSGTQYIASGDPRTMVLQVGRLSGNTTYELVLGSGIKALDHNIPLGQTITIPFVADANPTAPHLVSSFPASGASGIAFDFTSGGSGYISATFDKALSTISGNFTSGTISFHVSGSTTSLAGARFLQPGDSKTLILDPASGLSGAVLYQIVLGSGIQEAVLGIPYGQTTTIPFWSAANPPPPDTTPPFISSFSPAFNSLGVAVTVQPQFVFNEKIDSATLSGVGLFQAGNRVSGTLSVEADLKTLDFAPSTNLSGSTVYNIRASGVKDLAGNQQTAASGFSGAFTTVAVDVTPPYVASANPAGGDTNTAITVHPSVAYNEVLLASSVNTNTISLFQATNPVVGSVSLGVDNLTVTFTPSGNLSGNTQYNFRASGVQDAAGNKQTAASGYSGAFTTVAVDVTPPFVSSVTPSRGATGVLVTSTQQVVYNETLLAASVSTSTVQLYQSNNPVSGSVSLGGDNVTVTFTPHQNLSGSTTYNFRASGVKDIAGNVQTAASGFSGAFTTAAVDVTPPFVTSGNPSGGASGIDITVHPAVVYNEALLSSSVNTSTIALYLAGSAVPGSVALDATNTIATFTPSSNLNNSSVYNMRASGVQDAAGNVQTAASGYSGAFTTKTAGQASTSFYNVADNNSSRTLGSASDGSRSSRAGWRFTASSAYLNKKIVKATLTLQRNGTNAASGPVVLHQLNASTGAEKMRLFLNNATPTWTTFTLGSKSQYTWELSGTPSVTIASTDVFVLDISGTTGTGATDNMSFYRNTNSSIDNQTATHWASTDWGDSNVITTDISGNSPAGVLYEPA